MNEVEAAVKGFVELFVVVDPIGNVPAFLAATSGMRPSERAKVAEKAVTFATTLILAFAVAGKAVLDALGVSVPALMVAGGLLLIRAAFGMVGGDPTGFGAVEEENVGVAYVPLGTPLLAGPGAIVTVIVMLKKYGRAATIAACIGVAMATYVTFRFATALTRALGRSGISVLTRVMGVVLMAIGVQMVMDGVSGWSWLRKIA